MDSAFLLAIVFIFLSAIVSLYFQNRSLDPCLKAFQDFHVTLEEKDGDVAWGRLRVYRTGIELIYRQPNVDRQGHLETSYIFYREQFPALYAVYRYPEDLSPEERARRDQEIRRLVRSTWRTRMLRKLRNGLAMLKDAILQSIGVALGQARKAAPGSLVLRNHERELKTISKEVIGHVGNAFEPILERYIGRRVVMEITREGVTRELVGILKNYSAEFLEVLDVAGSARFEVPVYAAGVRVPEVELTVNGNQIAVKNTGGKTVYIRGLKWDGGEHEVDVVVKPGRTADFGIAEAPPPDARVLVEFAARYDLVVPRTHAIIRHAADQEEENWLEQLLRPKEEAAS